MKTRIISALVAIAILLPLLIIGGVYFAAAMGILSILAYKEILDLKESHKPIPNLVKIIGLLSLLFIVLGNYQNPSNIFFINIEELLVPVVFLLLPVIFSKKDKYTTKDAIYMIGSILLLGLLFNLLIGVRNLPGDNAGLYLLIYLLSVTISTDTFAYVIGILIGRHKMAPEISPKKSWEGAVAGLIGGTVVSTIVYVNLIGELSFLVILVTMILSIVGQMGDLVFSKIKRENKIKDFSNIMPGHGGILDRLDSVTFVLFMYIILSNIL